MPIYVDSPLSVNATEVYRLHAECFNEAITRFLREKANPFGKQLGLDTKFMSGDGTIDAKFIEIAGLQAAEGVFLTFSPDPKNIPSAKGFIEQYRAKFGEIGPYSIYAYDAANILLSAIKEAQSSEGKLITDKLHSLEFDVALGKITFDVKGDVTVSPYVVWITQGGKFVEYWEP